MGEYLTSGCLQQIAGMSHDADSVEERLTAFGK